MTTTTMPPATLSALRASIKHWRENVNAEKPEDVKLGVDYCPLCSVFYNEGCRGCPVSNKTERGYCGGSPYEDAANAHNDWEDAVIHRTTYQAAAQAELDFLISLLPEGETL